MLVAQAPSISAGGGDGGDGGGGRGNDGDKDKHHRRRGRRGKKEKKDKKQRKKDRKRKARRLSLITFIREVHGSVALLCVHASTPCGVRRRSVGAQMGKRFVSFARACARALVAS